jgi:hypothetical protein
MYTCGVGARRRGGRESVNENRRSAARLFIVRLFGAPPSAICDHLGYLGYFYFI